MFNNAHVSQSLILSYYCEATLSATEKVAVLVSNTKNGFSLMGFSFLFFLISRVAD